MMSLDGPGEWVRISDTSYHLCCWGYHLSLFFFWDVYDGGTMGMKWHEWTYHMGYHYVIYIIYIIQNVSDCKCTFIYLYCIYS